MKKYHSLKEKGDTKIMLEKIDSVFEPFTPAQMNIRDDLLSLTENKENEKSESLAKLSDVAISRAEDYIKKNPLDIRFFIYLARAYSIKGQTLNNTELLNKGEDYFKKMLSYTPNRPDSNYGLALNLFYQKKYDESFLYFEKAFNLSPNYFLRLGKEIEGTYMEFFQYFYKTGDKDRFIKVAQQLSEIDLEQKDLYLQAIDYIQKTGQFPILEFNIE